MKKFYTALLKNNYITNDVIAPVDVANITISKLSWKIANANTPAELAVNTMYYTKWAPLLADDGAKAIDYDGACNGAVNQLTIPSNVRKWYLVTPSSFMPNKMDVADIANWFKIGNLFTGDSKWPYSSWKVIYNFNNIFTEIPTKVCDSNVPKEDLSIQVDVIAPQTTSTVSQKFSVWYNVQSSKPLDRILLVADNQQVSQFPGKWKTNLNEIKSVTSSLSPWVHAMSIVAVDNQWFSNKKDFSLTIVATDTKAPQVVQDKTVVKKTEDGKYQVTMVLEDDLSFIAKWTITQNGKSLATFNGNIVSFTAADLTPVVVSVTDAYNNKADLTVWLPQ